jgi:hypothetical protein
MSWAAPRQTSRIEDLAYCLLGIFDLNLPLLYGEEHRAFRRLQEEIIRTTPDLSIFAWSVPPPNPNKYSPAYADEYADISDSQDRVLCGVLEHSPEEFDACGNCVNKAEDDVSELSVSNIGIKFHMRILFHPRMSSSSPQKSYLLPLGCKKKDRYVGIWLRQVGREMYLREGPTSLIAYTEGLCAQVEGTVQPTERHLLLKNPKRSGCQDFRFGKTSRMLPPLRSHILQITAPFKLIEPWPLDTYDHCEEMFFIHHDPRQDFAMVKIAAYVPIRTAAGVLETGVFTGWICTIGWSKSNPRQAQFSVIDDTVQHREAFDKFLKLAADSDYHGGQIISLLNSCGIPRSRSKHCQILGGQQVAMVTFQTRYRKDLRVSTHRVWSWDLSYDLLPTPSSPMVPSSTAWENTRSALNVSNPPRPPTSTVSIP